MWRRNSRHKMVPPPPYLIVVKPHKYLSFTYRQIFSKSSYYWLKLFFPELSLVFFSIGSFIVVWGWGCCVELNFWNCGCQSMGFWACWCGAFSVFFGFGAHKHRHRRITVCCSVEYSQNSGVSQDITNSEMFISMFRVINTHILFTKSGIPGVPQRKSILSRSLITLWSDPKQFFQGIMYP